MSGFRASRRDHGFTLLEMMVAVAIFGVTSVLAYGGLRAVLQAEERTEVSGRELADLQMAYTLLRRDLEQAVARGVRDEFGDSRPAMSGGASAGTVLELTRGGRPNPLDMPRSALQRVEYSLEDGVLTRKGWPVLDREQGSVSADSRLLGGVDRMELRFLGADWGTEWPPLMEEERDRFVLPKAVEITLELGGTGRVRWLFRGPYSSAV